MNGNVITVRCEGYFDTSCIVPLFESFESYFIRRLPRRRGYYAHVDFEHVTGADRIARKMYLDSLIDWHERYPFETYIISGARPILRATFNLFRAVVGFPMHLVKREEDVLPLIARLKSARGPASLEPETDPVAEQVEGLLEFVRSLDWSARGWLEPSGEAMKGPLAPIYDALLLIKESVDDFMDVEQVESRYQRALCKLQGDLNRLRRRDQERREFVEEAFHDIRTPLTLLRLQLDELGAKAGEANHADLAAQTKRANRSILCLSRRFSKVLELARLEAKREIEEPQPFNWPELVQDIAQGLTPAAEANSVVIRVDEGRGLPAIVGDLALLERAAENLLHNAIRHSPVDSTIRVDFEALADGVRMAVRDHGPGVSEEDRPHLFQRFYRSPNGEKDETGTGLGLAIVRRIAELHGGEVTVRNAETGGAIFSLMLPHRP